MSLLIPMAGIVALDYWFDFGLNGFYGVGLIGVLAPWVHVCGLLFVAPRGLCCM